MDPIPIRTRGFTGRSLISVAVRRKHTQLSGKETDSSEPVMSSVTVAHGNPHLNETGPGSYFEVVKFVNTEKINSTYRSTCQNL